MAKCSCDGPTGAVATSSSQNRAISVALAKPLLTPDISVMSNPAVDFEALRHLPVADRLRLVGDLWDSIAQDAPDEAFPMTPELASELDRRLADADANPDAGIPWEQVRAEILRRYKL